VQPPEASQFISLQKVRGISAAFQPADMKRTRVEVEVCPLEIAELRNTKTMPVSQEHHELVSVSLSALPGHLAQCFYLCFRQV